MESWIKFPDWARENSYSTENLSKSAFQYACDTDLNFFEFLHSHPPNGLHFDQFMTGYRQGRPAWMDAGFYPVEERLISGFEPKNNDALMVDIGGIGS